MRKGKIIIISGPSGSGKTTLHKKLLASKKLKAKLVKSISATTRPRRSNEKNGRDYLFLTPKQFSDKIQRGYFLEWQKVFDHYYGTPRNYVEQLLKKGKNVLLCIDVKGAAVIRRASPEAAAIFIKAPALAILKKRLLARGSESKEDLRLRLKTARQELLEAKRYKYVIVNDNLERSLKELVSVVCPEIDKHRNM